jgi:hypothetical protein
LRVGLGIQRIESGPDDQIEQQKREELVEAAEETVLRQPLQEQQPEATRKVTKQSGAQAVPRRLDGG